MSVICISLLLSQSGVAAISHLHLAGNATYTSHTSRDNMLEALFALVHADTLHIVKQATFLGVMVEETTDVSNLGQMAIHLRCVSNGRITTRFGGLCEIGARNAPSLQAAMEEKLADLHLDIYFYISYFRTSSHSFVIFVANILVFCSRLFIRIFALFFCAE